MRTVSERVIAADIEEAADAMGAQHLEDFLAIFQVRLVAGGAERGGGRIGDHLEIMRRLLRQIDEVLVDDAAHAVEGAIDALDLAKFARFQHRADERLVDDGGRAAALCDDDLGEIDGRTREAPVQVLLNSLLPRAARRGFP